ncbi:MAG: MFS transporter [Deferrisomatales bacterium]|nr:MFS transporter [Deferrisomatales bacterium]
MDRSARAWTIFAVMAVTYCFSQFYRMSTAVIAVDLAREFGLGPNRLSLLGGAFFYAFASVQIPLGLALDRWGAKRMVLAGTLCGAAGAVVFGLTPGWAGLLAGRVLMGLGMAPVLMGSFKLIAGWFPAASFGGLSGLMLGLGTLGSLVAATPLAALVGWIGWRGSFVAFGLATLGASAAIAVWVRDPALPGAPASAPPGVFDGLGRVLRLPTFWAMAPLALVGYASVASLQGLWGGPFFMESLGYSRNTAGNILLCLGLSTAAGSFLWGAVSDRWLRSRKWVVVGGTLGGTLFLLPLLGVAVPTGAAGWGATLFGFGLLGASRTLIYAHIKESVPPEVVGTAVTAINFFLMAGPALVQQALGLLLEWRPGDYPTAFLAVALSLLLGAGAYLATRDTHPSRLSS